MIQMNCDALSDETVEIDENDEEVENTLMKMGWVYWNKHLIDIHRVHFPMELQYCSYLRYQMEDDGHMQQIRERLMKVTAVDS